MKMIIYSSTFLPNIGGIERIMSELAMNWFKLGNDVHVITTVDTSKMNLPYSISRYKGLVDLCKVVFSADIFIEANLSLKTIIVGLLFPRKWMVIHHLPYSHKKTFTGRIKNFITLFSKNISVSNYVANTLVGKSIVVNNFYNPIYKNNNLTRQPLSLLFVGRLVSDKGILLLLKAFRNIKNEFLNASLVIVGEGDDLVKLQKFVLDYDLNQSVIFYDSKDPEELCRLYNQSKIVVIPSIWEEPFGLVAIEALACGCKVVYANGGGLPEAAGTFGIPFVRGSQASLERAIFGAFKVDNEIYSEDNLIANHLAKFNVDFISRKYIDYFNSVL